MKSHSTSYRLLVPWMAAWYLLLGGCSTIEIGNGPPQDRHFEPAPPAPVVVERLPEPIAAAEPPQDLKSDQRADIVSQQTSGNLPEPRLDSMAVDRVLAGLGADVAAEPTLHVSEIEPVAEAAGGPSNLAASNLEARHMPAAGAVADREGELAGDTLSTDFFRRMNARALVLHRLQEAQQAETVDLPAPRAIGSDARDSQSVGADAQSDLTSALPPQGKGEPHWPMRNGLDEPQFVASRVVEIPPAVAPEPKAIPRPETGLSARIGFVGDQIEVSTAAQERLEDLAQRFPLADRQVHISALAGASVRRPSEARWLALKRLFAVRDQLVAQGLDKAKAELDAGVLIDEGDGGDRVEISVGPAPPPKPQSAVARKPVPVPLEPAPAAIKDVAETPSPARQGPSTERPAPAVAPPTKRTVLSTQVILVQVGSHKKRPDALAHADSLKSRFSDLLDGQYVRITTVDLEGRGRYHRVRTGPFPRKDDASAFCRSLQEQGQDCLVVHSKRVQAAARSAQPP